MNINNTALAALSFVVIYNFLFFHTQPGVGTGLFFLLLNLYFYFSRNRQNSNMLLATLSSAIGIFFAFLFSFRDNNIVQTVNLITAVIFSLASLYFYKIGGQFHYRFSSFLFLPFLVLERSIAGIFSIFHKDALIRGFIITVPVFLVLLFLLTQADPIFNKLTQNLLTNIGERTIVSLILFTILLGFGLAKFVEKALHNEDVSYVTDTKSHELAVILISVTALFFTFIVIQFKYLFSAVGEGDLDQLGINSLTYSEYVRKGFFELLIASSIACGIIIYVFKYLYHLTGRSKSLIQIFSAILTLETGLLLLSGAKRVALYADAHGLTRARIFGFIFLIWLAFILSTFIIRIFSKMKREWLFTTTLTSIIIAFLLINLINIDGLIATRFKPTVNSEVDYFYITGLSSDASDAWKESLIDCEKIIAQLETVGSITTEDNRKLQWTKLTLNQLQSKTDYLTDKYGTGKQFISKYKNETLIPENVRQQRNWQSLNINEFLAFKTIGENSVFSDQTANLLYRINLLENRVSDEVRRTTPLDRSTQPPLL